MKKFKLVAALSAIAISGCLLATSCSNDKHIYIGNPDGTNGIGYISGSLQVKVASDETTCYIENVNLYTAKNLWIPYLVKINDKKYKLTQINNFQCGNNLTGAIHLSKNLQFLGDDCFKDCSNIELLKFYDQDKGYIINTDNTSQGEHDCIVDYGNPPGGPLPPDVHYFGCYEIVLMRENQIKSIGEYSFSGCVNLKIRGLCLFMCESLGKYAFQNISDCFIGDNWLDEAPQRGYPTSETSWCPLLHSIPEGCFYGVGSFGSGAFCYPYFWDVLDSNGEYFDSKVKYPTCQLFPKNISSIGSFAFKNSDGKGNILSFSTILIPKNISSIGDYAFQNIFNIPSSQLIMHCGISFAKGTDDLTLGQGVFYDFTNLEYIHGYETSINVSGTSSSISGDQNIFNVPYEEIYVKNGPGYGDQNVFNNNFHNYLKNDGGLNI